MIHQCSENAYHFSAENAIDSAQNFYRVSSETYIIDGCKDRNILSFGQVVSGLAGRVRR